MMMIYSKADGHPLKKTARCLDDQEPFLALHQFLLKDDDDNDGNDCKEQQQLTATRTTALVKFLYHVRN